MLSSSYLSLSPNLDPPQGNFLSGRGWGGRKREREGDEERKRERNS